MQFELPDQDLRQANAFINSVRTQVTAWRRQRLSRCYADDETTS